MSSATETANSPLQYEDPEMARDRMGTKTRNVNDQGTDYDQSDRMGPEVKLGSLRRGFGDQIN